MGDEKPTLEDAEIITATLTLRGNYQIHLLVASVGYPGGITLKCGDPLASFTCRGERIGGMEILQILFLDAVRGTFYGDLSNCIKADFRPLGA